MTDAEINLLIAKEVMGWPGKVELRGDREHTEGWSPVCWLPDAFEALTKWKKQAKGRYAEILMISMIRVQLYHMDIRKPSPVTKVGECEADTMPRAISLALVEAVKETDQ